MKSALITIASGHSGSDRMGGCECLSRDNLDENGGGNLEIEAAAGSGTMIIRCSKLCKHFFSFSLVYCR
jgi:hypothetical protein